MGIGFGIGSLSWWGNHQLNQVGVDLFLFQDNNTFIFEDDNNFIFQ